VVLDDGRRSWEAWEPLLRENGYEFALFDTLNRFYVDRDQPDVLAAMPRERAAWDAVTHMYEIGKAPENRSHPDHVLAQELTTAFWAMLPQLDDVVVAKLLAAARQLSEDEGQALCAEVRSERFKGALARIACGYDGGQVDPA